MDCDGLSWKSELEMCNELNKRISNWKDGQSKDGYVLAAEGMFVYRGVAYSIFILRYFNHTNKFTTLGSERVAECHCVVEGTKDIKELIELLPEDVRSDFLWYDTLHHWNDKMSVEEQTEECHHKAKEDIDRLMDGKIFDAMERKLIELRSQIDVIKSKVEELKNG
jgi:hypothetical protein